MAHYAFINENNIVTEVIVGKDENELLDGLTPEEWYSNFKGQACVRTSYNAATNGFRFNFAAVGFTYDPIDDAFIAPMPCNHDELILNDRKAWVCTNAECIIDFS